MLPPRDEQGVFTRAVLDVNQGVPHNVRSHLRARPLKRFNVYRNNIYASLVSVLQGRFPVVSRLIGEEFFSATARAYITAHPPVSPVLMRYGVGLADFLDAFEPVADVPYLGDIARLEWAWSEAYHAADFEPVSAEDFQQVPPDRAEDLKLTLHPSVHIVRSNFRVVTILSAHSGSDEPEPIDAGADGEDALIVRPHLAVEVRRLPAGGAAFISSLSQGQTLGQAAQTALGEADTFDFQANLAGLISSGAVAAFDYS